MKTLKSMTITEKAKLFHTLFKDQIPQLIDYVEETCNKIKQAPPEDETWDRGLFGKKLSFTIISQVQNTIRLYKRRMQKSNRLFADQLFDGNLGVFTIQCLRKGDFTDLTGERKINIAIDLFFNGKS